MNTFNRVVIVVVLVVLIPLVSVFLVIPHAALSDVGEWAMNLGDRLWAMNPLPRLGAGILLALAFDLLALLLIVLEVRPKRKPFIRVQDITGGLATVSVESVVQQLQYRLDPLPAVIEVKPAVQARRNKVQAVVDVIVSAGVNVPEKAGELVELVKDVLERELGLQTAGEPEIRITVAVPPKSIRPAKAAPGPLPTSPEPLYHELPAPSAAADLDHEEPVV
ncbi:MAG: hypothetical protein JXB35_15100 [Anaerolineae bacterium]|nr:hypothetical protein [Anaerolineae bacterium]